MFDLTDIYCFLLILSGAILIVGIFAMPILSLTYYDKCLDEQGPDVFKEDHEKTMASLNHTPSFRDYGDYEDTEDDEDYSYEYKPMDLYRSSYEDPNSAREDVFRQYDESRRISEDIQQFHESHPDADLSDHYNWEDVLDAQTDGYLDDESSS